MGSAVCAAVGDVAATRHHSLAAIASGLSVGSPAHVREAPIVLRANVEDHLTPEDLWNSKPMPNPRTFMDRTADTPSFTMMATGIISTMVISTIRRD
jgi:hypothetical protein